MLARQLKKGDVVALFGELGAGKTVFVQGLAEGLGIPTSWVKSPSFTLIRLYPGEVPFFHVDLFRLQNPQEEDIDWDELFSSGITVLEWAEKFGPNLPSHAIKVKISLLDHKREIRIGYDELSGF